MERLGPLQDAVDATVAVLVERKIVERAWAGDHTAWQDDPTEVADRLRGLAVAPGGVGARAPGVIGQSHGGGLPARLPARRAGDYRRPGRPRHLLVDCGDRRPEPHRRD